MKTFNHTIYRIPTWCLPVIFNHDYTGLTDRETIEINSFLDDLPEGHFQMPENIDEQKYFTSFNDVTDSHDYTVHLVYVQPNEFKNGVLWALDNPKIDVEFLREKGTDFMRGAARGFQWLSDYKKAKNAHKLRILNSNMKGTRYYV